MEGHTKAYYKYCIVPMCENNIKTAPDKIYFHMPKDANIRKKWCKAMRRDNVSCLSSLFVCEDHFDIEKDTENYIKYKIMALEHGQKVSLLLKKGVVPHIFQCQKKKKLQQPPERKCALKRKRQALIEEALAETALSLAGPSTVSTQSEAGPSTASTVTEAALSEAIPSTASTLLEADLSEAGPSTASTVAKAALSEAIPSTASIPICMDIDFNSPEIKIDNEATSTKILHVNKAVQVTSKIHYRSKGINVNLTAKKNSIALSPFSIPLKNVSTSPLKSAQSSTIKRKLFSDNPADIVSVTSVNSQSSALSTDYEPVCSTSDSSWFNEDETEDDIQFKKIMRNGTLIALEREPKMLLGLPKNTFYLIKLLSEYVPIPTIDIFITLRKIKLNESFNLLALHFGYSQSTISRIFSKSIVVISKALKELIVWPTPSQIFEKLPISFRARYSNVVSIIDCLEIQIEKPSNPVHQALSWSQYKKCNTLKYLISCTPDGLVNYISDGYSGRATDVMIVEDCGYLEHLPPQKAVMADRGFKDLTRLLINKNCTLVRPPSVSKCTPSTKEDVKQSKRIAALRIHVERVIGRLREFHMLLPHACIDHNLIPIIDEIIIIACGLINLQDVLIKA